MSTFKIRLRGQELPKEISQAEDQAMGYYNISRTFTVESSTRSDVPEQVVELGEDEVLELNFEDNSVWLGDADSIKQIFAKELKRGGDGDEVYLSGQIETDEQDRSLVQTVVIKAAKVFVKNQVIRPGIRQLATKAENSALKFGGKTFEDEGAAALLAVGEDFELTRADLSKAEEGEKYLMFVHGTGSSTLGSFAEMKDTAEWKTMVEAYGKDHLLALQHRTLTCSPLENVLAGLEELPVGITLDLVTHSRGGLVGDLLARFASHAKGFGEAEMKVLKDSEREADLNAIQKIAELIAKKKIKVDRVVRVACPANGTTLASKRLDMFLNVVLNLLGTAIGSVSNPIFATMKELVLASIETKDDVGVLPGLESMNPESPFIKVLNFQGTELEVDSKLIVIAGSSEISISLKSLVVLVGKFFFRGKNDLVVDTASMEFGAKRKAGNVFLYMEETGEIDHIKYFKTPRVRKMIQTGLIGKPEEFVGKSRTDGITFLRGEDRGDLRGGLFLDGGVYSGTKEISGKKPILILLPGIMGSNLRDKEDLLWIKYTRFLLGHLKYLMPSDSDGISADSLIKTSYKRLGEHLEKTYDVVAFPFDWRLGMKDNAAKLNKKIREFIDMGQPIKMVGHSMGGVLIRDFILYHSDTFKELNSRPGFKILFLGSPLGGSYRIPYVLFGRDGIIKLLGKIDITNTSKDLMGVFVNFPGILALLPINKSGKHDFSDRKFWEKLRKASGDESWPIPSEHDLKAFGEYQKLILEKEKDISYENIYYIAGQSRKKKSTISDLEIRDGKLYFDATNQGDESVTWESGIPKAIIAAKHLYYANVTHGALSAEKKIFGAIEDILTQGKTGRLQNALPIGRGDEKSFPAKEEEVFDISEENMVKTLLGIASEGEEREHEAPIQVKVSHGDLSYADYPVLAGHFQFDAILTTERAIDRKLQGELSRLLSLGLYPGPVGTHQVVLTQDLTTDEKNFKGTVVVGFGVPGELTPYQMMVTVSKGVARYLTIRNIREDEPETSDKGEAPKKKELLGISILALATSYGGFSSDTSIRSIILGIQEANRSIRKTYQNKVKVIEEIEIIELYQDRALGILRTVKNLEQDESREFNISVPSLCLNQKIGRLSRIPHDNTSDWWTRIKVTEEMVDEASKTGFGRTIRMALATTGASEKEVPLLTNTRNIETLLVDMTRRNQYEPEIAKTMFEQLIPFDFKEDLKRQNNITWVLDKRTANFPWEMLQEDLNGMPLCIHSGMVRQLATTDFRRISTTVQDKRAYVVGDPDLKGFMGQLKGAEREANHVAEKLKDAGFASEVLINSSAPQIILKLFSQNYKIIHLAGHGVFNADPKKPTGMVIGDGYFLTPSDISQLSKVPEFVFVNCCYLGHTDAGSEEMTQNRNKLAANIGTQLIEIGVKAVIVAGWAVDDSAAFDFCRKFYECFLGGVSFGEAVKAARKYVYEQHQARTNTWGAYQCYGDPFYKIDGPLSGSKSGSGFYLQEEVEIELFNLCFQLESKSVEPDEAGKRICDLEEGLLQANLLSPKILEYKADVYAKLGDYLNSKKAYEQLFENEKAGFSFKAIEQYCNIAGKYLVEQNARGDAKGKKAELLTAMDDVIQKLHGLLAIGKTSERYSLLGSAYKRKLMLLPEKEKALFTETLLQSANAYYEAAKIKGLSDSYAINNCVQLGRIHELLGGPELVFEDGKAKLSLAKLLSRFKQSVNSVAGSKKDFWDYAAESNLLLSGLMLSSSDHKVDQVKTSYEGLWKTAGSPSNKKAELEHLDILLKGLALSSDEKGKSLHQELNKLRGSLNIS
ncbi:CHAT domain-containing protein [Algoriphagus sp. H41]|uniref:CHAT domain-containing protein n=1 Tax=Algoriphagus oliviformis TaxID=2811231 RepID=A0ABS3C0L2_9BACT|nr:CHAT domain-containing protein [Algoriphagus oliviformis]MBN7810468.1 CHAT domain-containing protein [Algoriphagus oliviformis]